MRYCDFGHETSEEVRRLPIGGESGIWVCHAHYLAQLRSWKEQGQDVSDVPAWEELPTWEDLEER